MQLNELSKRCRELTGRLCGLSSLTAYDALQWRHSYILPLKNLRIPVAVLRGSTPRNNSSRTLLVAGDENRTEYMSHRFFEYKPSREEVGKISLWNLPHTLRGLRTSADFTIACVDKLSARLLFDTDYLSVPEWTGLALTVPEDVSALKRGSSSLKEDLRILRLNKLTYRVTRSVSDFESFYHTMYVPFLTNRHGSQAIVRSVDQLRRRFRQGGLIWALKDEQPIAGAVFQLSNKVLRLLVLGTVNGDWVPVKSGALTGLYLFVIKHAKKIGCEHVDLGGSRPSLNDGLLRYKRKWGQN